MVVGKDFYDCRAAAKADGLQPEGRTFNSHVRKGVDRELNQLCVSTEGAARRLRDMPALRASGMRCDLVHALTDVATDCRLFEPPTFAGACFSSTSNLLSLASLSIIRALSVGEKVVHTIHRR
jgi:hypothetical protein